MKHLGFIVLMLSYTLASGRDLCEISTENQESWNLVGLPIDIDDTQYQFLFPNSIEGTLYSFMNGAYILETELNIGQGYWLRFSADETNLLTDECIFELTIALVEGWNLITVGSCSVNVNDIYDPSGIIQPGTLYGFNETYFSASYLNPGEGYWIRTSGDGDITLGDSGAGDWDGDACTMPEYSVHLSGDGSVLYNTATAIGGFQFNVDGATVVNASGGAAEEAGFSIFNNGTLVFCVSFSGISIDGCGTLIVLELDGDATGLSEIIFVDPTEMVLPFTYFDGNGGG